MKEYYTYAYLREDKTPYYIGKGKKNRAFDRKKHTTFVPSKNRILILKQNLTEEEAFKHEIYMIDVFGRKDLGTGILHNRTDGGEGSSGCIPSEETKRKLSEANKGRILSEETKRKIGEASKGKTVSEETKRKMSDANKGHIVSEESRKKMSDAQKGKTLSKETRRKKSVAMSGKKWWNDGCGNCKMMIECPGDGWKPGRK